MQDWNIIVTIQENRFKQAVQFLEQFGTVDRTDYYNVLAMRVVETASFLEALREAITEDNTILESIARVLPVETCFSFQTPPEFEGKSRDAVIPWVPKLAGKSFHVRMHRRGFKGRISSQEEERFLDHYLIEATAARGAQARLSFEDPDVIIALETLGQRAGLSLWPREERAHYPFLKLD